MENEYYKIGDISRIFNLSVQTLRYYDKIGLFVPSEVSGDSGYRYYSWEQFERLRLIIFLKDLGFSLKDIKQQLYIQNIDEYVTLLEKYRSFLSGRIQSDIELKRHIDSKIEDMTLARDLPHNKTLYLRFSECEVLKYDCIVNDFHENELAIADFRNKYRLKSGINIVGQVFSPDSFTNHAGKIVCTGLFVSKEMFTPDTRTNTGELITVIPSGIYAVMYYQKPTEETLPFIYELLEDVKRHSFVPCGDIFRTITFDLGRGKTVGNEYLACIRVLVTKRR